MLSSLISWLVFIAILFATKNIFTSAAIALVSGWSSIIYRVALQANLFSNLLRKRESLAERRDSSTTDHYTNVRKSEDASDDYDHQ